MNKTLILAMILKKDKRPKIIVEYCPILGFKQMVIRPDLFIQNFIKTDLYNDKK